MLLARHSVHGSDDHNRELQTLRLVNRHKRHTTTWCVFRRILIFVDTAILQKTEKLIEQSPEMSIKIIRREDSNVMQVFILIEQL